jgi:hypothetical protein
MSRFAETAVLVITGVVLNPAGLIMLMLNSGNQDGQAVTEFIAYFLIGFGLGAFGLGVVSFAIEKWDEAHQAQEGAGIMCVDKTPLTTQKQAQYAADLRRMPSPDWAID